MVSMAQPTRRNVLWAGLRKWAFLIPAASAVPVQKILGGIIDSLLFQNIAQGIIVEPPHCRPHFGVDAEAMIVGPPLAVVGWSFVEFSRARALRYGHRLIAILFCLMALIAVSFAVLCVNDLLILGKYWLRGVVWPPFGPMDFDIVIFPGAHWDLVFGDFGGAVTAWLSLFLCLTVLGLLPSTLRWFNKSLSEFRDTFRLADILFRQLAPSWFAKLGRALSARRCAWRTLFLLMTASAGVPLVGSVAWALSQGFAVSPANARLMVKVGNSELLNVSFAGAPLVMSFLVWYITFVLLEVLKGVFLVVAEDIAYEAVCWLQIGLAFAASVPWAVVSFGASTKDRVWVIGAGLLVWFFLIAWGWRVWIGRWKTCAHRN
ncbi:MAG: hypothetical protein ACP5PX_07990 [Candidatus Hadarchaeum sp.]|uniref:hypothetical protein n=1 Tax=Candidatus Hadarchaeum sp. TaxID=2883567 RepID=UPI003D148287